MKSQSSLRTVLEYLIFIENIVNFLNVAGITDRIRTMKGKE